VPDIDDLEIVEPEDEVKGGEAGGGGHQDDCPGSRAGLGPALGCV
jgi:hypothetical protein